MKILMNGLEVRKEELAETVEIQFAQLNEVGQKRLFKENKDLLFSEALLSKYENVRKLAIILRNDCSSDTINKAIRKLLGFKSLYTSPDYNLIFTLLNTESLLLTKGNRILLAISSTEEIQEWLTQHRH